MSKKLLTGITVDSFAHPYDLAGLENLAKIPILPDFLAFMVKYFQEVPDIIDLLSSSIKVTTKSYGKIYDLLIEACQILDISPPPLFVSQKYEANAYTLGIKNPMICLYTGLIDILDENEIQGVIAHELGHIKARHVLYHSMVNFSIGGLTKIFIDQIPFSGTVLNGLNLALMSWLRKCELTADRAELLVTQNPDINVSICMKLSGGSQRRDFELSTEDFLDQSKDLQGIMEEVKIAKFIYWMSGLKTSHPLPVPRSNFIYEWGKTDQYKRILDGKYKKYPIKTCPNCKKETAIDNHKCPFCLTKFKPMTYSYCYDCSNLIDYESTVKKDIKVCPNCGAKMKSGKNVFNQLVSI